MLRPLADIVVGTISLPDDLVYEELWPKHRIHQNFEVMAGSRVAMEIDGAGLFENAAKFDKARGHHRQIRHHVGVEQEGLEGTEGICDAAALLYNLLEGALGVDIPLPCVLEGANLRAGLGAILFCKQNVVILARIERRVEVDKVYGLVFDVALEDIEIVSVIELVLLSGHRLA
jgi:hypothetical protein